MTATAERRRLEIRISLPLDRYLFFVVGLVLMQVTWLGYLASRGWFYADDLSYMSEATGADPTWSYLSSPLNDHFVPGVRLAFWLMRHTTRLDYGATVFFRMALQAGATLLLYRLLVLLVGRRPGVVAVVGWYAFSPMIMPGFVWLTTSVHLLTSQVFVILTLDLHVRYTMTGRIRFAVGAVACLLAAMAFWEMTAITALLLPIISLGFLYSGSFRDRLRAALRRWPGWLAVGIAGGGWLAVFLSGPYGGSAHAFGAGDAMHVLRVAWLDAVAPALIGGPWRWFARGDVYFSVANPWTAEVVLAQVCVVAMLVIALRRTGPRALLAWMLPATTFVIGTLLVAVGRYWFFGDLAPKTFNYIFDLGVPAAVGAALSFFPSTPSDIAARVADNDEVPERPARALPKRAPAVIAAAVAFVLVLGSSVVSMITFSERWARGPSHRYVRTLVASVRDAGPGINLWDTRVPERVLSSLSSDNRVSDVLQLANVPAKFDDPRSDPMLIKDDGSLAPSALYPVATGIQRPHTICTQLLRGVGTWVIELSGQPGPNEFFFKISYLQQKPTVLYFRVRDSAGREIAPATGARTELDSQLANVYLRLPVAAPRELVIRSENLASNVCIGAVTLGFPVPRADK